uniref:Uncharacterized protein n=1 Tax=Sphaerodactylus townsendi TaxID=933632 RepID=A0ACB8G8F0_9SAUR
MTTETTAHFTLLGGYVHYHHGDYYHRITATTHNAGGWRSPPHHAATASTTEFATKEIANMGLQREQPEAEWAPRDITFELVQ